jgi:hypothetical protein
VAREVTRLAAAAVRPTRFFAVVRAMTGPLCRQQHVRNVWRLPHVCGEDMPLAWSRQQPRPRVREMFSQVMMRPLGRVRGSFETTRSTKGRWSHRRAGPRKPG